MTSEPPAAPVRPTMLEQMGGVSGIVASTNPVVVFVVSNVMFEMRNV